MYYKIPAHVILLCICCHTFKCESSEDREINAFLESECKEKAIDEIKQRNMKKLSSELATGQEFTYVIQKQLLVINCRKNISNTFQ